MVRLTDRPDMTLDVYRGRRTTIKQQSGQDLQPVRESYHGKEQNWVLKGGDCYTTMYKVAILGKFVRKIIFLSRSGKKQGICDWSGKFGKDLKIVSQCSWV